MTDLSYLLKLDIPASKHSREVLSDHEERKKTSCKVLYPSSCASVFFDVITADLSNAATEKTTLTLRLHF
jgi:hypothetical protein